MHEGVRQQELLVDHTSDRTLAFALRVQSSFRPTLGDVLAHCCLRNKASNHTPTVG